MLIIIKLYLKPIIAFEHHYSQSILRGYILTTTKHYIYSPGLTTINHKNNPLLTTKKTLLTTIHHKKHYYSPLLTIKNPSSFSSSPPWAHRSATFAPGSTPSIHGSARRHTRRPGPPRRNAPPPAARCQGPPCLGR